MVRPYIAWGRSQFRVGWKTKRPGWGWDNPRFRYIGITWQ